MAVHEQGVDDSAVPGRRGERLRRLAAAALVLNSTVDLGELSAIVTAQARELTGADAAATALAGTEDPPDSSPLLARVRHENRPLRLDDDPAQRDGSGPRGGRLAAPLVGRDGENLGAVELVGKEGGFSEEDEAILVQLAQMASAAVENARLYTNLDRRAKELEAINRLADSVARADTVEAVFDAALDALARSLGLGRSSVVLFEPDGSVRFGAWRGLSDAYVERVEGSAPWRGRAGDPEPFVVGDVLADPEVAELHDAFRAERVASMALVPLVHGGRVLGRFVLYGDERDAFGPGHVRLAETMASHVAAAVHRRRAEAAVRGSRDQLEAIFSSVAEGITAHTAEGRIVFANEAAARLSGFSSLEEFLAVPPGEVTRRIELLDEHGAPLPVDELPGRKAIAERRECERVVQYRLRGSGERRWSLVRARPVVDEESGETLAINVFHELTRQRRAEERLRVLADAGRTLSSSTAVDRTLLAIARLLVPSIADYCLIDLLGEDGSLRHIGHVHAEPDGERTLDELRRRWPVLGNPGHPVARVVATGEPFFEAARPDDALDDIALDEEHRALYRRLAPSAFLAVPLVARDRTLGAISLGTRRGSGRTLDIEDLALAVELAERAALAVDNALLLRATQAEVEERQRSEERLRALGRASGLLGASLDYERTLAQLARLVVPGFADWCVVYEREPDGGIRRLALEHAGGRAEQVREVLDRHPLDPDAPTGVPAVIRTGQPELVEDESAERLTGDVTDPGALRAELDIAPRSSIRVPLIARGRTLGAMALLAAESGRTYGPEDLDFAVELAGRAAVAVDNARLFAESEFQRAVLEQQGEASVDGLLLVSPDGAILSINRRFGEIWQIPDDVLARGDDAALAEALSRVEDPDGFIARVRELYATHETSREELRFRDGRTIERHGSPVTAASGEYVGYLWSFRDITDRKRAEEALAVSEQRFRSLVTATAQIIWTTDASGSFVERCRSWEVYTGQGPADYLGGAWGWLDAVHPEDREVRQAHWAAVVADPPPLVEAEYRLRRADGEYRRVTLRAVPMRDAEGGLREWVGSITDVEDELRAREALDRQHELTRTITENASSALFLIDERGRPTYLNLAAEQLFGYTLEELREATLHDAIHHTRADGSPYPIEECPIDRALPERRWVEPYEDVFVRKDGTFVRVAAAASPIVSEGRPVGTVVEVRDLTDEHRIRELRDRADARLRFVAEASEVLARSFEYDEALDAVARLAVPTLADYCFFDIAEADGSLTRVAAAHAQDPDFGTRARRLARYSPEGPVMRAFSSGRPVVVRDVDEAWVKRVAGSPEQAALIAARDISAVMAIPVTSRRGRLGVLTLVLTSDREYVDGDLETARELARRAAVAIDNARLYAETESRAQAAQALEFVGDGVFTVDADGVVRLWNPAAERISGLRAGDVVGRPAAERLAGWPLDALAQRPQTYPVDVGGRELWLSLTGVRFAGGTVYAFRDLTEERAVERLKTDFVSTVSHELRTPLAAIYGAAMTLQRRDVDLGVQREGLLAVVAGEAERLARIVNDVLWASRLDSGLMAVSIESCDAAELAGVVIEAARAHLPAGVEVVLDAAPGLPRVAADPDKVRQVLVNLVDNAVKYSPDGGRVHVRLSHAHGHVRFAVSDRGLGIPAAEHGRIFEKFFRLDPNLTRGVGGTGLGLYICRELVRRMHGRIWVDSSEGAGSTFTFELPVAPAEPA